MGEENDELRSFSLTPTWSVATVLTIFIAVSLLVERAIHHLSSWLQKTNRKPLFEALEKMKEELMLLGFMSLLLTATSRTISSICIPSKFYEGNFSPCSRSEAENMEEDSPQGRKLLTASVLHHSFRRGLSDVIRTTCKEDHEPFVSYEGLEQLHRFIFVMAVTHIFYSCLTMLLAIVKIHTWRKWEDEAHIDRHDAFPESGRESTMMRHSMFVKFHLSKPWGRNGLLVWVECTPLLGAPVVVLLICIEDNLYFPLHACRHPPAALCFAVVTVAVQHFGHEQVSFFRQFAHSVHRTDYLTLRLAFIMNHNLTLSYDFHSYMVRSMEEEFPRIVGVSLPLWGFVVAFMLFDVDGADLYFWLAIIPITLVLVLGTKLQQIIATLVWENAGVTGFFTSTRLRPRDDLFWFKKPELILSLIHFVLFQNAFELATFFWFWWQFGYRSCFLENHWLVYARLILGFAGQFLCSYSTLPLYALVTQMGTNYKAALIPDRVRETIHGWNKEAKKRRRRGTNNDDSTVHTETSTVISVEDDEFQSPSTHKHAEMELEPICTITIGSPVIANESSSRVGTPLLKTSASVSSPAYPETPKEENVMPPTRSTPIQRRGSM